MAFPVPAIGSSNATQDPKIKEALEGLNSWTGTYRTLLTVRQLFGPDGPAGTYMLGTSNAAPSASGNEVSLSLPSWGPFIYFDDADFSVTGLTQKLRLRAQIAVNATKPTLKFTFGMYPLTVAGGADSLKITLGTVVSGSTVEINEPAASTIASGTSSEFTIPSDGAYGLGVVTSGTQTNNNACLFSTQLQTRSI